MSNIDDVDTLSENHDSCHGNSKVPCSVEALLAEIETGTYYG